MTKRKGKRPRPDDESATKEMFDLFTVAYILDAAGVLDLEKRLYLDSLPTSDGLKWHELMEESHGLNRTLVRSLYSLLSEHYEQEDSLLFILRGYGCPEKILRRYYRSLIKQPGQIG